MTRKTACFGLPLFLHACALPPPQRVAATVPIPVEPYAEIIIGSAEGSLARTAQGCLVLERSNERAPLLLVWAPGSRFDGHYVVAANPHRSDRTFAVGDAVRIEGTSNDWAILKTVYPELAPWRERCRAEPYFVSLIGTAD